MFQDKILYAKVHAVSIHYN